MVLYGTTHRVGDDVTAAQIIAPDVPSDDPAQLAAQCLAAIDPTLAEHVADGDVLLAGRAFGEGDAPETAVLALQALGFAAVICHTAAPPFVAIAQSYGLPVIEAPEAADALPPGAIARIDLERGNITDQATKARFRFPPCSPELSAAVRRARLLAQMRRVVEEEGFGE